MKLKGFLYIGTALCLYGFYLQVRYMWHFFSYPDSPLRHEYLIGIFLVGFYWAIAWIGLLLFANLGKLEDARQTGFAGQLSFRRATASTLADEGARYDAVLGFYYLHLVGDLPAVLGHIRTLLVPGGLFISKTPCVGDMNRLIRLAIPLMRLVGKAPSVTTFSAASLAEAISADGFEILENERHAMARRSEISVPSSLPVPCDGEQREGALTRQVLPFRPVSPVALRVRRVKLDGVQHIAA